MDKFIGSQDVSESNLAALRADLAVARRMMGDSPPLLVTEALYARLVDFDGARALRSLELAATMNPNSSEVFLYLARSLSSAGRVGKRLLTTSARRSSIRAIRRSPATGPRISRWRDGWRKPCAGRANSKRVIPA